MRITSFCSKFVSSSKLEWETQVFLRGFVPSLWVVKNLNEKLECLRVEKFVTSIQNFNLYPTLSRLFLNYFLNWYSLRVLFARMSTLYNIATYYRAQNLRQGIVMKTSFETRVSRMGLGSFVDINIFVMKYYLILVFSYSPFFKC